MTVVRNGLSFIRSQDQPNMRMPQSGILRVAVEIMLIYLANFRSDDLCDSQFSDERTFLANTRYPLS